MYENSAPDAVPHYDAISFYKYQDKAIVKNSEVPYMNDCLRHVIKNVGNMLKLKFYRYPSNANLESLQKRTTQNDCCVKEEY